MDEQIASVSIGCGLDLSGLTRDLDRIDKMTSQVKMTIGVGFDDRQVSTQISKLAQSVSKTVIRPTVDHKPFVALNKHIALKDKDIKALAQTYKKTVIAPVVDDRAFAKLDQSIDRATAKLKNLESTAKRVQAIGAIKVDASGTVGGRSSSSVSSSSRNGDDRKLAQEIGREVAKNIGKGSIGGTLKSIASIPLKIAGNAAGKVAEGITYGITQEVSRNFGQGLSKAIERSISGSIGSTELAGEKIGEAIAKGIVEKINKRIPGALDEAQDALKESLGADSILQAGLFTRSQQRREQQRRSTPVREQATIERRELLRSRIDAQNRVESVRNQISLNQEETNRTNSLRERLNKQVLREQMLGASPQRIASFDATLKSLNQRLDFLSKQEQSLGETLAEANKNLQSFDAQLEKSKQVVQKVSPEETPSAYRQAVERVAGRRVSDPQIPRLVVADAKLKAQNARAAYGIESNTLQVTSEMKKALDEGKLTIEQMEDLFHELQHAMDFNFGSFEGVQARREGRILTQPAKASVSELREIAPLINQYDPKERLSEVNAEILGRRNARSVFAQQQRQDAIGSLYNFVGYGGVNIQKVASKQIESTTKQLQSIRNLANDLGINVEDDLKGITSSFKAIAEAIEDLGSQSLQLDDLDPDQINDIAVQFEKRFKSLEEIQKIVDRFQSDFLRRGRAVRQGQQIKTQAQQQLDGVRSILDEVSKRSFDLNVAVGKRFGEIQEAYELLSSSLQETYQEASQQTDITPEKIQELFAGQLEGIETLQEAAESYQSQFEKRVKATRIGRGVRSAAEGVGSAAQRAGGMVAGGMRNLNTVIQSPQVQGLVKGLGVASQAAIVFAKTTYKAAELMEAIVLTPIPGAKLFKSGVKHLALPAATFAAAEYLLPGGHAAAQGALDLAQGAAAPFLHGGAAAAGQNVGQFFGQHAPTMLGIKDAVINATSSGTEFLVTRAGQIAVTYGTMMFGGKALQNAATLPLKAAAGQTPLQLPAALPDREKMALPSAKKAEIIRGQSAQIEQSHKDLAKKAAYTAGQTTKQALDAATKTIDVIAKTVKAGTASASDTVAQAQTISKKFIEAYANFKEQSDKGNKELAKAHALTIAEMSEKAIEQIDKLIKDLKTSGIDTNFAKTLGGTLQGIKGQIARKRNLTKTYVEKNADVTPYIDVSARSADELESQRLRMPQVNEETIADMGVNLVGAVTSALAGQHGIVAELAGDLLGALTARVTYQVGKAGVKAYSGVKQDPAYAAMTALEKFSKLMNEISNELQSDFVQKEFGNQLTGDVAGFAIGNATRLAANTVEGLSGIPLKGAAAAMLTVPQIQKLREQISQRIAIEQGGSEELESQRLDLNKLRGGKGLSEDELNQLKALNQLLEEAEKAADIAEAALKRMGKEASQAFNQSQQGLDQAIESFENGEDPVNKTTKAIGGFGRVAQTALLAFAGFKIITFLVPQITKFGEASLNAALEFDRFNQTLKFATGSGREALDIFSELSAEAGNVGFNLKQALAGRAQLEAAAKDTPVQGFTTELLSDSVNAASAVSTLTAEQQNRAFVALSQVLGKATVQSEELKGQLAEVGGVFSNTMGITARAYGVSVQQLTGMMQRGEILSQEFAYKFGQQLQSETAASLDDAANSAQAAMNRVENATFGLQVAFGKTIQPAQIALLNTFAGGLSAIENNIGSLMQAFTAIGIAIASSFVPPINLSGQALLAFGGNLAKIPSLLISIIPAIKAVVTSVSLMAARFALVYAAIQAAQVVFDLFSDKSGELGKIAGESSRGVDKLAESLDKAAQSSKNAADSLKGLRATGIIGDLANAGSTGDAAIGKSYNEAVQQNSDRLRNIPVIGGALAKGNEVLNTDLSELFFKSLNNSEVERQVKAYNDSINTIVSANQDLMQQSQQFISNSSGSLQELQRVNQQIEDNQAQQRSLRIKDPGNIQGLKELQKQEAQLIEQRGQYAEQSGAIQAQQQAQIDRTKQAIEALEALYQNGNIDQGTYNKGLKDLNTTLAQLETSQIEFNKAIGDGALRLGELTKQLQSISDALADAKENSEIASNIRRSNIAQTELDGKTTPGQTQAGVDASNIQGLQQQLNSLNTAIQGYTSILQDEKVNRTLEIMGITDPESLGSAEIETLRGRYQGAPAELQALDTLTKLRQARVETSQVQSQIDEAQLQAQRSINDAGRQILEFYRNIQRQTEDVQATIEQMNFKTKMQNIKNEFQAGLSGFSDAFFGDMWGAINELFEIAQRKTELVFEAAERERQYQRNAEDSMRDANNLRRSTYGASGTPTGGSTTFATGTLSAQEFGAPRDYGGHAGQDIDISGNDAFKSVLGGEVVDIYSVPGYDGKFVKIQTDLEGVFETIAEGAQTLVNIGDRVSPGQVVQQGEANSGVIHYQIDVNGAPVDPIAFLQEQGLASRSGSQVTFNYGGVPGMSYPTAGSVPSGIENIPAAPGNFREGRDAPINRVILHETVGSAESTVNAFQTPGYEASYHYMVRRDGSIVNFVDPADTAYGAYGANQGSIHISFESPEDGRGNGPTHSGYTGAQYESAASLIQQQGWAGLPITTHQEVDTTGERFDPRSFDADRFQDLLGGAQITTTTGSHDHGHDHGSAMPSAPAAMPEIPSIGGADPAKIRQALEFYIGQGMPPQAAAYLVGNLIQESGLDPAFPGDGGQALGLAQWHPDRRYDMPSTFEGQLPFVLTEMQRDSPDSYDTLMNPGASTADLQSALKNWERYGVEGDRYLYGAQLNQLLQSAPGGFAPSYGTPSADTSLLDAGGYQSLENARQLSAASQAQLQSDLRYQDVLGEMAIRRADRARERGLVQSRQQNTELERQQTDLALQGFSNLPAAQTVSQLMNNARGLDDSTIQNQQKLVEMSDRISDFEFLVEQMSSSPEILQFLGGVEELEKYKQALAQLYPDFEKLKQLVDSESGARSQANAAILEQARATQLEQQKALDQQTEELEIQRQLQQIRDPQLQQLAQFRTQRSNLTRQYENDRVAIEREIAETVRFRQELERLGHTADSLEIQAVDETLTGLEQKLDSIEGNYQINLDIIGTENLRAIEEFQRGQQEQLVQGQASYYNSRFAPFEANRVQRQFGQEQEQIRYQQELGSIGALEMQMMGQEGYDASVFEQMRSDAEQLNALNLDGLRQQFQSVGDSINKIAIDGFGSLVNGIDDVIFNGGKLTDLFDQVSKSIIDSLLQIGTQFLQSQLYNLFFPQQQGAMGGGGLGNLFGGLMGGVQSLSGASLGSSGISAGGGFNLGGATGGGGGFNWSSLLSTGLSLIGGFDKGGLIPGTYTGAPDQHLARVNPGEFVMSRSAVQRIGVGNLDAMNNAVSFSRLPKFNDGGYRDYASSPSRSYRDYNAESEGRSSSSESSSGPIEVKFQSEIINSVEYVRKEQFEQGMKQAADEGAKRGEERVRRGISKNPTYRQGMGIR